MRKFFIAAMAASLVFLTSFSPAAASSQNNAVFTVGQSTYVVNGLAKQMDAAAFLQQPQDRVFVPVRYLAYALGLTDSGITWDQTSQMAILTLGNTTVVLSPKEKTYYVNGQAQQMDTLPLIKNSRLYLPARYVAQAFGYSVSWDQSTDSVVIGPGNSSTGTQSSTTAEYNMQIVPLPSSAQAGQSVQLDISVTNTNNQAASGATLVLTSNSSTVTLNPAEVVTNASGQAIVTATDTAAETVTFTATILNSYTTATASVQWTQSSTLTGNYTVQLSPSTTSATEGQPVVFTATVDNSAGSPVSGTGVTVASSSANAGLSATSLVTNAQGQAFFTATDSSAETVTFTATPTGGGSAQTAGVTWTAPPSTPSYTSYTTTPSLAISSTATTAALGQPVEYTVTATGSYGAAAATALYVTASSANVQLSSTTLTTNNAGQAFFTATDNVAESVTFTVRMSSSTTVMNSATTQWLASYSQTNQSTTQTGNYYLDFSASNNSATTGQPVVFTVTVGNNSGNPVSGAAVSVSDNSANVVLSATSLVTNVQGQAFFTATDNSPENVTFTATPAGGSSQTTTVQWTAPMYTPTYSSNGLSSMQISSTASTAVLGQPVAYTVAASGGYRLPADSTLVVTSSSANVQLSSTILTTNSAGQAFFTATDRVAESVTLTVSMSSEPTVIASASTQWLNSYVQSNNLLNNAPIYLLSMSPSSGIVAVGQPVVLNLTVLNNNNQLAAGIGISLISSSAYAQLSSTYVTTNSQGHAYVTVSDRVAENVTFTGSLANVTSRQPYVTISVQWSGQVTGSTGYSNKVAVAGYYVTLSESATSAPTGQPVVLTATVTNSSNEPVSGLNLLLVSSSPNVQLTGTNSVTNSQGQVFVTAVDNTAENPTFSVQLETNGTYSTPVAVGNLQWY